jgi:serine/threonine protein kinase
LKEHTDWKDFLAEVYVWKISYRRRDKDLYISPLLCTFEVKHENRPGEYYLLFPWASGDLTTLWARNPKGGGSAPYTLDWMAKQCWGMADTLSVIHHDAEENKPRKPGLEEEELFARHGDMKPGNILWFGHHVDCPDAGTLAIADFGISKCHRYITMSMSSPLNAGGSPTYMAPEFSITGPEKNTWKYTIGRKADIWGLACTWIELVVWYLEGWNDVRVFDEAREETDTVNPQFSYDRYFTLTDNGHDAAIKDAVLKKIENLHRHHRCNHFLHDFLSYIEQSMLVVDPVKRVTANNVAEEVKKLYDKISQCQS